jgi:hypothetical protein
MGFRYALGGLGTLSVAVVALAGCLGKPATASPSQLGVTITGLPANASLSYGGRPIQFTVTVRNASAHWYRNILPIVALGHCTCSPFEAQQAPGGTMAELDTATGKWNSIYYDSEGPSDAYLLVAPAQFPSLTLGLGGTARYRLRIAFSPLSQQGNYSAGQTTINVTLVALPSRTVIGSSPDASVSLAVTTS